MRIPTKEDTDDRVRPSSHLGQLHGVPKIIIAAGNCVAGSQRRVAIKYEQGFRLVGVVIRNRQALATYMCMRTNKGQQRQWLHL